MICSSRQKFRTFSALLIFWLVLTGKCSKLVAATLSNFVSYFFFCFQGKNFVFDFCLNYWMKSVSGDYSLGRKNYKHFSQGGSASFYSDNVFHDASWRRKIVLGFTSNDSQEISQQLSHKYQNINENRQQFHHTIHWFLYTCIVGCSASTI